MALVSRLYEEFKPFLLEKYGDREYARVSLLAYPVPRMTKNGTIFVRFCFLFSRSYLKKFFGYLTTNTERNAENGIILHSPYGLRAALEFLGINVDIFMKLLIKFNFSHHPDNPEFMRQNTNLRQDFKLLHPDMHEGANPLLVQLRNVPPSHNSLPRRRRQPDANAFDIRTLVDNLASKEDRDSRYRDATHICEQLRSFRDKERILEKLNLLTRDAKRNCRTAISIMLRVAGVNASVNKFDVALEKLATRLNEGDDFVHQEDVFACGGDAVFNRGHQAYKDALVANASAFSQAQTMPKGTSKNAALKAVRENVISSVTGRFMHEKNGALQVIPEKELHKKIKNACDRLKDSLSI